MDRLLRGLLLDLRQRGQAMQDLLTSRLSDPDLSAYVGGVRSVLESLIGKIEELLADPDFGAPPLLLNQFQAYKRLAEALFVVEAYPLPVILRYSEADRRWYRFSRRLAEEIRYPLEPPVVFAGSKDYYWAHAPFNLIALPACEDTFLLGLPDFFHELGHHLFFWRREVFTERFLGELVEYVRAGKREVDDARRPPKYKELYDWVYNAWKDQWLDEFVTDMIATYLVGPAYGWQHLRLCAKSHEVFRPGPGEARGHPSDEARMRGILAMLQALELTGPAANIEEKWNQYLTLTSESPPADYHLCYPDSLLHALTENVLQGCRGLNLRPFSDQPTSLGNIPYLLNEAWDRFLADPSAYRQWEAGRLEALGTNLPS